MRFDPSALPGDTGSSVNTSSSVNTGGGPTVNTPGTAPRPPATMPQATPRTIYDQISDIGRQLAFLAQQSATLTQKVETFIMAYIPATPPVLPKVVITGSVTLTLPGGDTRYPVNIAAATVITLPAADGSGKKLYFDFDSLAGFTPTFALSGTDAFVTPLPSIVQGETFGLVSDTSGKWSIE